MASTTAPYLHLFRVLRSDEDITNGIRAKRPKSTYSVETHVGKGSYMRHGTKFISTTATFEAAERFAKKGYRYTPGSRTIVRINTSILLQRVKYIDLTDEDILCEEIHRENDRARNFARCFEEVLIVGYIPGECIDATYRVWTLNMSFHIYINYYVHQTFLKFYLINVLKASKLSLRCVISMAVYR